MKGAKDPIKDMLRENAAKGQNADLPKEQDGHTASRPARSAHDFQKSLENIQNEPLRETIAKTRAAYRGKEVDDDTEDTHLPRPRGKAIYLPECDKSKRAVPNVALRSALFPAIQGKRRRKLEKEVLPAQADFELRFTGLEFDQADLDVWQYLVGLAQKQPLGNRCFFSAHALLKALRRSTGTANHKWLKNSLCRLAGAVVEIKGERYAYCGALIDLGMRDDGTRQYWLMLNPQLIQLFSPGHWTAVDWEQRHQLRGKPLALWLHGFYVSHKKPYSLKISYLRDLSGSQTKELKHFRINLIKALQSLQAAKVIASFDIRQGRVHVAMMSSDLPHATTNEQPVCQEPSTRRFDLNRQPWQTICVSLQTVQASIFITFWYLQ